MLETHRNRKGERADERASRGQQAVGEGDGLLPRGAGRERHRGLRDGGRPANTTMGGLEFIDPAILVEVEVTAVVDPG
jgi:hypothetical protein